MSGATGASVEADSRDQGYRWLAASGMTEFGLLCALGPPPCPDAAEASSGETMEITREGTLVVKYKDGDLKPKKGKKSATGGGSFRHLAADGSVIGTGTWTVKKLISFDDYGPDLGCCPERWGAGNALFEVKLVSDTGIKFGSTGLLTTLKSGYSMNDLEIWSGRYLSFGGIQLPTCALRDISLAFYMPLNSRHSII